ncbi:unnamed protein product, partial [Effrenium voratum]
CLLLANALAAERGEEVSDALIERAVAVVGGHIGRSAGAEDVVQEPKSARRVLMPGTSAVALPQTIQRDAMAQVTPRVSREVLLQPRNSVHPVLPGPHYAPVSG